MQTVHRFMLPLVAVLAPDPALGWQGSDDCAGAVPLVGVGVFGFDNASATSDPADLGCDMSRDVWFAWSPQVAGNYVVRTCGHTSVDTALAVYEGTSCPSQVALDCDDDECGLQSEVAFSAALGQTYTIRLGTSVLAGAGGAGSFEVAFAQCPFPDEGANVVAGELSSVIAWGEENGIAAYSVGTTACNLGDEELLWMGVTEEHPVVGHNLYRLEDGRFEQIGMSWVKHAFAAFQRDLCCTCIASSSISSLGVGCSDPYSAATNGVQASLGPRGEVNAFEGVFPFPPGVQSGMPPPAGDIARRLQVAAADLDPALHPDAEYFIEAVYAAPDDAAAGNGFDNASYRPYVRGSAGANGVVSLIPAGMTVRGSPALRAWAVAESSVRLEEVRLPGDGAFWIASDAIDEGGGTWRYEVALFNLNSDRGIAAIGLPGGVSPRDLTMSFPRSHSGETRKNTPWNSSVNGEFAVFVAPSYAVDPDANAILWGTCFSFSYRSDAPPVDGAANVVMFRGPGPALVTMPVIAPRAPGAPVTISVCDAEPNTLGAAGRLLSAGFDPATTSLELVATGLPSGVIGLVIVSNTPDFVPLAGGSAGNLCLGGSIGRSVGAFTRIANAAGQFRVTADGNALPQPTGTAAVSPGETWYFQAWHRDAPATSNFTEALAVTF